MMDPNIKIAQVEQQLNDSLKIISKQMSQVNESLIRIAEGVTSQDIVLGALRYLLVDKGILADAEIENKAKELIALIRQKEQEAKKEERVSRTVTVDDEVTKMGMDFAKAENQSHPPEAYFFGG